MEDAQSNSPPRAQAPRGMSIQIQFLPPGSKLRLRGGDTVEVVANPQDGGWLFVKYLTSSNPANVGTEAMLHASDFSEVIED